MRLSIKHINLERHCDGVEHVNSALGDFLQNQSKQDSNSKLINATETHDDFFCDSAQLSGAEALLGAQSNQLVAFHILLWWWKRFNKYSSTQLLYCKVKEGVYKAMSPTAKRSNSDLQLAEAAVGHTLTAEAMAFDK